MENAGGGGKGTVSMYQRILPLLDSYTFLRHVLDAMVSWTLVSTLLPQSSGSIPIAVFEYTRHHALSVLIASRQTRSIFPLRDMFVATPPSPPSILHSRRFQRSARELDC
jgi:hypothetical protein